MWTKLTTATPNSAKPRHRSMTPMRSGAGGMRLQPRFQHGEIPDRVAVVRSVTGALVGDQLVEELRLHDAPRLEISRVRVDQLAELRMGLQPDAERQAEAVL